MTHATAVAMAKAMTKAAMMRETSPMMKTLHARSGPQQNVNASSNRNSSASASVLVRQTMAMAMTAAIQTTVMPVMIVTIAMLKTVWMRVKRSRRCEMAAMWI